MNFDLKTPCKDCPFLATRKFPLMRERVEQIVVDITVCDQSFSCHKTVKHDHDGEHVRSDTEQHCAGALIMLEHMDEPNQMMRIAERVGLYDRRKLNMDAPVFTSTDEMLAAPHWLDTNGRRSHRTKPAPAPAAPVYGESKVVKGLRKTNSK